LRHRDPYDDDAYAEAEAKVVAKRARDAARAEAARLKAERWAASKQYLGGSNPDRTGLQADDRMGQVG
jgi:hypothetical protein